MKGGRKKRLQPYCANCDHFFEVDLNPILQGRRFECPCGHFSRLPHIAAVGRNPWQHCQVWLSKWQHTARLAVWGRLLIESLSIVLALLLVDANKSILYAAAIALAVAVIGDQLLYNAAIVFTVARPRNGLRTIAYAAWGVTVFCGAWGVIDKALSLRFDPPLQSKISALYFSVVTFATVGFGDLSPHADGELVQVVVALQILTGAFLLVVILANFASWSSAGSPRLATLTELIAESMRIDQDAKEHAICNPKIETNERTETDNRI